MLIGEELWKYLESKGVVRHKHTNGLMSCYECSMIVATGKTKQELEDEWQESLDKIYKEMFGEDRT